MSQHSPRSAEDPLRRCVRKVQESPDFPAFAEQMRQVMTGLLDTDATVQQLANLVLGDYALSAKLLRTANSPQYNRSRRPVRSATHAMMLVGARTVRDLAGGMLLLERYRDGSPGLRELLMLSMLSAHHAREAALVVGHPEPESAQLAAMFHNLGEVLVARHLPDAYARVRRLCVMDDATSAETAARRVLRFGYADLAVEVSRLWGMPPSVQQAVRARGEAQEPRLDRITRLSHELTQAVYRTDAAGALQALREVEARFAARLDVDRPQLRAILGAGLQETRTLFADLGVTLDDLRLARQTREALQTLGDGAAEGALPPAPAAPSLAQRRQAMLAEMHAAAAHGAGDLHALALVALEAALRGAAVDQVAFCLFNADRSVLRGRFGLGEGVAAMVPRLVLPAAGVHAFARLLDTQLLVLGGPGEPAAADRLWLNKLKMRGAAFLPIEVEGSVIGTLCCACTDTPFPDDEETLAYLRTLCAGLARSIETLRRGSQAGDPTASLAARGDAVPNAGSQMRAAG
jgi:HD-like signal output (HDOD) protein